MARRQADATFRCCSSIRSATSTSDAGRPTAWPKVCLRVPVPAAEKGTTDTASNSGTRPDVRRPATYDVRKQPWSNPSLSRLCVVHRSLVRCSTRPGSDCPPPRRFRIPTSYAAHVKTEPDTLILLISTRLESESGFYPNRSIHRRRGVFPPQETARRMIGTAASTAAKRLIRFVGPSDWWIIGTTEMGIAWGCRWPGGGRKPKLAGR